MNYAICFVIFVAVVVMLIIGDQHPRVDGSEWRVRPSDSGKTWVLYRWVGLNHERSNKRFKTRQAAEEFARLHFLRKDPPHATAEEPTRQFDEASLLATRLEHDIARARSFADELWTKGNNSLAVADATRDFPVKTAHLRIAKQSLDQIRRHSKIAKVSGHIDVEDFERRLRSSAASVVTDGGAANPISDVRESPTGSVPAEVKVAVWSRDGGACVHCGSTLQLRFAPVSSRTGGDDYRGTEVQLECSPCSIRKSTTRRR